jgi:hypothetical protein
MRKLFTEQAFSCLPAAPSRLACGKPSAEHGPQAGNYFLSALQTWAANSAKLLFNSVLGITLSSIVYPGIRGIRVLTRELKVIFPENSEFSCNKQRVDQAPGRWFAVMK